MLCFTPTSHVHPYILMQKKNLAFAWEILAREAEARVLVAAQLPVSLFPNG